MFVHLKGYYEQKVVSIITFPFVHIGMAEYCFTDYFCTVLANNLARSANLPEGLYILLALISSFFFLF